MGTVMDTTHNPDRFMADFRLILSQGRKRLALLVGAGGPVSVKVDATGKPAPEAKPLIPDVAGLTNHVLQSLEGDNKAVVEKLLPEIGQNANIEALLSRVRLLGRALGTEKVHGFDGPAYEGLGRAMCDQIGKIVNQELPPAPTPYSELVTWVSGTAREHPVEIFTTNYDLLFEEAFERARVPYFDGFAGGHAPFFDPSSVSSNDLPARWTRLPQGYQDLFGIVSEVGASAIPEKMREMLDQSGRWMRVQLAGEAIGHNFERGISQHPNIGDAVHLVTDLDLKRIYGSDGFGQVVIGVLSSAENINVRVGLDALVTRHSAILGSTGSGKSTTVASLLRSVVSASSGGVPYPSARILMLDIHGE